MSIQYLNLWEAEWIGLGLNASMCLPANGAAVINLHLSGRAASCIRPAHP